jgi:hypothetical protein
MKLSGFIIGTMIAALAVTIMTVWLGGVTSYYGADFNNTFMDNTANRLHNLSSEGENIKTNIEGITQDESWLDKIGGFFSSGWGALKITFNSFTVFEEMSSDAFNQAEMGNAANYIKMTLMTIVIILLFVGIGLGIILKTNRT